jgi:gas vesicle protein
MSCNKVEAHEVKAHERRRPRFGYFLVGIGFGTAISMLFANRSGEENRKEIAKKVFDAVENANDKVWQSRAQVKEYMDRRQQQVSEFLAAGRDAMGVPTPPPTKAPVM